MRHRGIDRSTPRRRRTSLARVARRWPTRSRIAAPTAMGVWVDAGAGLALSHRRLAIIDLTPAGAQPMLSAGWALRDHLQRRGLQRRGLRRHSARPVSNWRGHSDTEVMVESFAPARYPGDARRFNGMFALALWDRTTALCISSAIGSASSRCSSRWQVEASPSAPELKALRAVGGGAALARPRLRRELPA